MLTVEIQEPVLELGQFVYSVVASVSLHDDGRVEMWDPTGFAKDLMGDPVPVKSPDGSVRRLFFQEDPGTWLRGLGRILHGGAVVPVVVRDDAEAVLTRDEVARRVGVSSGTWGGYVSRGQAPQPVRKVGATPLWSARAVDEWQASRPGRGGRRATAPARG
jgi:predicted DNA-binding transcriptional regulator AlpA